MMRRNIFIAISVVFVLLLVTLRKDIAYLINGRYYDDDNKFSIRFLHTPTSVSKKVDKYNVEEYYYKIEKNGVTTRFRVISFDDDSAGQFNEERLEDFIKLFMSDYNSVNDKISTSTSEYKMCKGYKGYHYGISNYYQKGSKERGRLFIKGKHIFLVSVDNTISETTEDSDVSLSDEYDDFVESFRIEGVKTNDNFFPGTFKIDIGDAFEVQQRYRYDTIYTYNHDTIKPNGYRLSQDNREDGNLMYEANEMKFSDTSEMSYSKITDEIKEELQRNKHKVITYNKSFSYKQYKGLEVMETETSLIGIVASSVTRYLLVNNTYYNWSVSFLGDNVNNQAKNYLDSFDLKK